VLAWAQTMEERFAWNIHVIYPLLAFTTLYKWKARA
jgi:hypothetical protein